MGKRLYIGNLPFSCTDEDLRTAFEAHGAVESANLIFDRETGRSRGFVETNAASADTAIRAMAGQEMDGRPIRVNEANERRPGGGGDGNRGGRGPR